MTLPFFTTKLFPTVDYLLHPGTTFMLSTSVPTEFRGKNTYIVLYLYETVSEEFWN